MGIKVNEGKDISSMFLIFLRNFRPEFSMFQEEEVLLLPNTIVKIDSIASENMKMIMDVPPTIDVLQFTQMETTDPLLLPG